jgi:hypothetical protein
MTQQNIMSLKAGPNQVHGIINQIFFLKSDINFMCQFFSQTEFYPINKCQFETSEAMGISNIMSYYFKVVIFS